MDFTMLAIAGVGAFIAIGGTIYAVSLKKSGKWNKR